FASPPQKKYHQKELLLTSKILDYSAFIKANLNSSSQYLTLFTESGYSTQQDS
ncbi:10832_t:CDS:1, partial [Racocetra fulgida]